MQSFRIAMASAADKAESRHVCEIELTSGPPVEMFVRSERFGPLHFVADSLFGALSEYRRHIEKHGYLLLCNAARRDAYPSPMTVQMGGGRKVYLLRQGRQARREDLVDALGEAPLSAVCTVTEQRVNYEAWVRSLQ